MLPMGIAAAGQPQEQQQRPPAAPASVAALLARALHSFGVNTLLSAAPAAIACLSIWVGSLEAGAGTAVDKSSCTCSCWDGRFKGRHARGGYKHMYFNITWASALMLIWTALWLHLLGLALARIWTLAAARRLRPGAAAVAAAVFYPTFYGAWAVINYLNEGFYMLPSQLFFSATELLATSCIYAMLDSRLEPTAALLATPIAVNAAHVAIAVGSEGILWGLFADVRTANARDVALMAGDFAQLGYFGWHLARLLRGGGRGVRMGASGKPRPPGSDGGGSGYGEDFEQGLGSSSGSNGGRGGGADGSTSGLATVDAATRRQLAIAAACSVGLFVSYHVLFAYPVSL